MYYELKALKVAHEFLAWMTCMVSCNGGDWSHKISETTSTLLIRIDTGILSGECMWCPYTHPYTHMMTPTCIYIYIYIYIYMITPCAYDIESMSHIAQVSIL